MTESSFQRSFLNSKEETVLTSTISFPGLNIGPFEVDPVAFSVPGTELQIRWYGVIIMLGMVLGVIYAAYRAKQSGISVDTLLDYVLFAVPVGIVCARLYYVLFNLDSYHSFYDVIAVWEGGLAIYGGVIGGIITMTIVSKVKKSDNFYAVLDCCAPAVMIGQIFGRWGNFFNAEAYGTLEKMVFPFLEIHTDSFAKSFPLRMVIENLRVGTIAVHPTFLYESLWNLCGFVIIHTIFKRKKFDGQIVLMYITWYGFGRFFVEALRADSLMLGAVRVSQLVALLCVVAGVVLLSVGCVKAKRKSLALDEYVMQFSDDSENKSDVE